MGNVVIEAPPSFYVVWHCRRCGMRNGMARAQIPVTPDWNEPMIRHLLDSLRQKLVRMHMRSGCIATTEDFVIERGRPESKQIVGLV